MRRTRFGVGVTVVVMGTYGCGSTMYTPRPDGRIAVTSEGGTLRFNKSGTSLPASVDNLQQMVADNPAAAEAARQSASDFRTGLVLDLGGLAATIGGAIVMAPGTNPDGSMRPVSDTRLAVGGAILLGGLVSICAAISYLTSGQARQLDAINMYNDGVGAWPPPGAAPAVSPVPLAPPSNGSPPSGPLPPAPVSPLPPAPLPPPTVVPELPAPPATW